MPCKNCGGKLLLGRADIIVIRPDPEPYEPDKEIHIDAFEPNISLDIHYCENCGIIHDIWDDENMHLIGQKA